MNAKQKALNQIIEQGILPLYFHADKSVSIQILQSLYRAGIRCIEYTNRGEQALQNFKALAAFAKKEYGDLLIGAGTIKNKNAAADFIQAGADFIISPGLNEEAVQLVHEHNLLCIPGCMTVSEIMKAESLNVSAVKIFPANVLGASFITSVKEIFPQLHFIPTGGIDTTEENLRTWFNAGVSAVGLGSKLISNKLPEQKDFTTLELKTRGLLQLTKRLRE